MLPLNEFPEKFKAKDNILFLSNLIPDLDVVSHSFMKFYITSEDKT